MTTTARVRAATSPATARATWRTALNTWRKSRASGDDLPAAEPDGHRSREQEQQRHGLSPLCLEKLSHPLRKAWLIERHSTPGPVDPMRVLDRWVRQDPADALVERSARRYDQVRGPTSSPAVNRSLSCARARWDGSAAVSGAQRMLTRCPDGPTRQSKLDSQTPDDMITAARTARAARASVGNDGPNRPGLRRHQQVTSIAGMLNGTQRRIVKHTSLLHLWGWCSVKRTIAVLLDAGGAGWMVLQRQNRAVAP